MSKKTAVGTPDPDGPKWETCGNPDCACRWAPVNTREPDATIVKFDGVLSEDDIADLRDYAGGLSKQYLKKINPISLEPKVIRRFESGATRDSDEGKLDFEAYLNPLVLLRYAEYMQEHETRADGTKRAPDDWQQGMPSDTYMKSMTRHAFDVWLHHRNYGDMAREDLETALCAVIFNACGYLFNELEGKD